MISNEKIIQLLSEDKPIFEPDTLEFKKAEDMSQSLLETICAFAFSNGGTILLGMHQQKDGKLKCIGIQNAESQENKLRDILRNKIENLSEVNFRISIENFDGYELPIIKIHIEPESNIMKRPTYIKARGMDNGSFMRVGQRDEHIPQYLLNEIRKKQMIKEGTIPRPELQKVDDSKIIDINIERVKEFADVLNIGLEVSGHNGENFSNFLESKNIVKQNTPTLFGVLCFSEEPQKYLTYRSGIQVSNEIGVNILEGERGKNKDFFEGNITKVIEKTIIWVIKNIDSSRIVDEEGKTEEISSLPVNVIREVVVNAFCHRDYNQEEKMFLKVVNGVEITIENPGILDYRIYNNNFILPGKTNHPNPEIANYLYRVSKIAEGEGKGFTSLLKSCLGEKIDIPKVEVDFAGRVKVWLSGKKLVNKEIIIWLDTKKYLFPAITLNATDKIILAYLYKSHDLRKNGYFVINLTEECLTPQELTSLEKLKINDLVKEERIGSTKIFFLNEELLKNDYSADLINLFGADFRLLDGQSKQILSIAIQFEKISEPFSASKITRLLYPNTPEDDLSDDIRRKIRKKCNTLLQKEYLCRDENVAVSSPTGSYKLNRLKQKKEEEKDEYPKKELTQESLL
jgi:ATP-dependent DNA helicase RecG